MKIELQSEIDTLNRTMMELIEEIRRSNDLKEKELAQCARTA